MSFNLFTSVVRMELGLVCNGCHSNDLLGYSVSMICFLIALKQYNLQSRVVT